MIFALILAILLPMLLATAFLLGRHLPRRRELSDPFSPVTRQHFEIFQGGRVNEAAVEKAKRCFSDLLERGDDAAVEASLRPGMHYVFQVRALAEIGTDAAGEILERQLQRHLTDDQLEQSWYWIDLAGSLRSLNRMESLPYLLRCADSATDVPLGHFFAAETVCFLGFTGYLHQTETALGRAALRLLHRALEGLRYGLPPHIVTEARLGEMLEGLWDNRPGGFHPLMVRVAYETLRFIRRAPQARAAFDRNQNEIEAFDWQFSRLLALELIFTEFVADAVPEMRQRLAYAHGQELNDLLQALVDLRVDAGTEVLEMVRHSPVECSELAVQLLAWSKNPTTGSWLRARAAGQVPMHKRGKSRPRTYSPPHASLPEEVHYEVILRALKGHPSRDTEKFLILAAHDWDPLYREAAFSGLGWWEPLLQKGVRQTLEDGRRDPNPEVRQAARAALARLGERAALHWFRQGLTSEDPARVHETVQMIAKEGLTLLWPDLDRLADSDLPEIAQMARESLERMAEELDRQ